MIFIAILCVFILMLIILPVEYWWVAFLLAACVWWFNDSGDAAPHTLDDKRADWIHECMFGNNHNVSRVPDAPTVKACTDSGFAVFPKESS